MEEGSPSICAAYGDRTIDILITVLLLSAIFLLMARPYPRLLYILYMEILYLGLILFLMTTVSQQSSSDGGIFLITLISIGAIEALVGLVLIISYKKNIS